jgi:DUF4097 and DUF4098 domain-containing protein YvlB
VVSTTWEEQYEWNAKSRLFINGEHADIHITTHGGTEVLCKVTRSSRHEEKAFAAADLDKLKLITSETGSSINIRNYVELPKGGEKPASRLKTTYEISIPKNVRGKIEIWNYFGTVTVDPIACDVSLKVEFSKVNLKSISGSANIDLKYSDAAINDVSGSLDVNSLRSGLEMQYIAGSADIRATYTRMRLLNMYDPNSLRIDAQRSEVFLDISSTAGLGYDITTSNVEINHPSGKKLQQISGPDGSLKLRLASRSGSTQAAITLHTGTFNYILQ